MTKKTLKGHKNTTITTTKNDILEIYLFVLTHNGIFV